MFRSFSIFRDLIAKKKIRKGKNKITKEFSLKFENFSRSYAFHSSCFVSQGIREKETSEGDGRSG